jgi:hypothetical protein
LNVCRISGKLPAGGCDHVQVANRDGLVEDRSMIYTEYFVRGTQPDTVCPLHQGPSFTERLAGIFGKGSGTPISADSVGLPPPTASTSGAPAAPGPTTTSSPTSTTVTAEKPEEPKKKRGFWSRVFGRGDDRKDEDKKQEEERKKKEEEQKRLEERRRKGG